MVKDVLISLWHGLNGLAPEDWSMFNEIIFVSIVVPLATELLKHWKRLNLTSGNKKFVVAFLLSIFGGALAYLHGQPEYARWFALAQGAFSFTLSQPLYRFALKPLFAKLALWWQDQLSKAAALNEAKAAAVPQNGEELPL